MLTPGNSCTEVDRQFTINKRARKHQIECQQPVGCEVHLNVVSHGWDLHHQLAIGVVLFRSEFIQIRHDKRKQS